jgi:hypothetical protein
MLLPLPGLLARKGTRGMIWTDGCGAACRMSSKTSTVDRLDLYARTPQAACGTVPGDDCAQSRSPLVGSRSGPVTHGCVGDTLRLPSAAEGCEMRRCFLLKTITVRTGDDNNDGIHTGPGR